MYKVSEDRRFRKIKREIQQAYFDLTIEKGYKQFSITDVAKKADINRMTFYSHYDTLDDIFDEFVDDMKKEIMAITEENDSLSLFFRKMNQVMYRQLDFFTYVSKEGHCADFREAFRQAVKEVVKGKTAQKDHQAMITNDLYATCIAYAYLDYLSGTYGEMSLDEVIAVTSQVIQHGFVNEESY